MRILSPAGYLVTNVYSKLSQPAIRYILCTMQFEKLYKQFVGPLTKFVFKKIGSDPDTAEDIIAQTFEAAWKGYKSFKNKSSFFTWLCRIALNKIADYYHDQVNRKSRLVVPLIDAMANADSDSLSPEELTALNDLRASVNECLDLLPPDKRKLLQFRYWYNLSYTEISKIMGISERAVEGKIYRAKHSFAKAWSENPRNPKSDF